MHVLIISDIHDHMQNLRIMIRNIPQRPDALLCCGDLCSPFVLAELAEAFSCPQHYVLGNNDGDTFRLMQISHRHEHVIIHGEFFRGEFDGRTFAANHFPQIAHEIARNGQYEIVCYGHDHNLFLERREDVTLLNPGTLMGYMPAKKAEVPPTFVIYETVGNVMGGYAIDADGIRNHQFKNAGAPRDQ